MVKVSGKVGTVIVGANLLDNSMEGKIQGSEGLKERLGEIRTILYIDWARYGFSKPDSGATYDRMCSYGLHVIRAEAGTDLANAFAKADAIYLGGGHPGVLMWMLRKTGADILLQRAHQEGKLILGASAGGMVLGSGGMWLGSLAAGEKPARGSVPLSARFGIGKQQRGLGLFDFHLIPHNKKEWYPKLLQAFVAYILGVRGLVFSYDGTFEVFEGDL